MTARLESECGYLSMVEGRDFVNSVLTMIEASSARSTGDPCGYDLTHHIDRRS